MPNQKFKLDTQELEHLAAVIQTNKLFTRDLYQEYRKAHSYLPSASILYIRLGLHKWKELYEILNIKR